MTLTSAEFQYLAFCYSRTAQIHLKHRLANYSPLAKSRLLSAFVSKLLLVHSQAHSSMYHLLLLIHCNSWVVTDTLQPTKLTIRPLTESLCIPNGKIEKKTNKPSTKNNINNIVVNNNNVSKRQNKGDSSSERSVVS